MNLPQNAARHTAAGFVELLCANVHAEDAACSGLRHPNESAAAVSLHFAVRDTGCGMTPDMQATLFDRYRSIGGVGLGLYLTKRQS